MDNKPLDSEEVLRHHGGMASSNFKELIEQ